MFSRCLVSFQVPRRARQLGSSISEARQRSTRVLHSAGPGDHSATAQLQAVTGHTPRCTAATMIYENKGILLWLYIKKGSDRQTNLYKH